MNLLDCRVNKDNFIHLVFIRGELPYRRNRPADGHFQQNVDPALVFFAVACQSTNKNMHLK